MTYTFGHTFNHIVGNVSFKSFLVKREQYHKDRKIAFKNTFCYDFIGRKQYLSSFSLPIGQSIRDILQDCRLLTREH